MQKLARLALAALASSCGSAAPEAPVAAARPDLLVITVGRLGPAAFEPAGRAGLELPALDALLAGGISFPNAVTPAAGCDANLASVLTGLHPRSHGTLFFFYGLAQEHATVAELLRAAGYRTGAFTTLPPAEFEGFDQGFDVFEGPAPAELDFWTETRSNARVLEGALAWLRAAGQVDEPWFCWIHLEKALWPRGELSAAQLRILPPDIALSPAFEHFKKSGELMGTFATEFEPWLYRLALVGLDEDLQPLASQLGERPAGRARPRVTLLTALRGESEPGSPLPVLEAVWHVPLVLAGGRSAVAGPDWRPASLLDVLPTLLGQAGVPWTSPDGGLDLLRSVPDASRDRLFVHDEYELDGDTHVAARIGERMLWVQGKLEGTSARGSDISDHLTEEEVADLRLAYEAWSALRQDPARLRRRELDAQWKRTAGERLQAIEGELQEAMERHR